MHLQSKPKDFDAPTLTAFIKAQGKNLFSQQTAKQTGQSETEFSFNKDGVLIRRGPNDRAMQKLVTQLTRLHILYLSHHPPLAGHTGLRRMYPTMRQSYYCPNMVQDVYYAVSSCHSSARNGTLFKHKRHMQLFQVAGPLAFVVMDILGPLSSNAKENKYIVVITDEYSKHTRAFEQDKSIIEEYVHHNVHIPQ